MGLLRAAERRDSRQQREQMKAGLRLSVALLAAGLCLGPLPALAQSAPPPTTNTPATETIGPRELQNFTINGTITRPAETPPPRAETRPPGASTAPSAPRSAQRERPALARAESRPAAPGAGSIDLGMPSSAPAPAVETQPGFTPEAGPRAAPADLASERTASLLPWLIAAAALGVAGAFLFYRRQRSRLAYAGGEELEFVIEPEAAAPRPSPPPAPKRVAPPRPVGVVSSSLRPWIDIEFEPLGCVVEPDRITVDFNVHLFNSGSAVARAVLVEASMFNAGPSQDQDIATFFENPVAQGERIPEIPPLRRMTIRSSVIAPRANVREAELGGRPAFVPLLAFNALYRLSGADAQTSASFLLGRATKSDKLAPLRLDLGPRAITGLGARLLPIGVRK
jgi:hypothetical protein